MVSIQLALIEDMPDMQILNLQCLPENYQIKYYMYHLLSWPELSYVARDPEGKLVGYVLGKIDDEDDHEKFKIKGHITSLAVKLSHRKLGIAEKLVRQSVNAMINVYRASHISLHVRVSNRGAIHLYRDLLNFEFFKLESKYYSDFEDAYVMVRKTKPFEYRSVYSNTADPELLKELESSINSLPFSYTQRDNEFTCADSKSINTSDISSALNKCDPVSTEFEVASNMCSNRDISSTPNMYSNNDKISTTNICSNNDKNNITSKYTNDTDVHNDRSIET